VSGPAARIRAVGHNTRRALSQNGWALGDQALISATNFATTILLARELTPRPFGAFVLAYTSLLLLNGLQSALVTQPHNVLGQARRGGDYRVYTSSTGAAQVAFAACFGALSLLVGAALLTGGESGGWLAVALTPALIAWQLQEFARRVLYTEHRFGSALAVDVLSYGGQLGLLATLVATIALDPERALLAVAATSAAGALLGAWLVRRSLTPRISRSDIAANWKFGRWLGAAIATSWLAGQLYLYLAAILLGATAAGALRAAQVLLGPVNAFLLFLSTALPIHLAAAREREGEPGLDRYFKRAFKVSAPPVIAYCVAIGLFATSLLELLYGPRYDDRADVVVAFCAYYALMLVVHMLTAALTARQTTRPLFFGTLAAAVFGILFGWPLIAALEEVGAVVGMILGAVIVSIAFGLNYRTSRSRPGRETDVAKPAATHGFGM